MQRMDDRLRGGPLTGPGFHLWKASLRWSSAMAQSLKTMQMTHSQFFVLGAVGFLAKTKARAPKQSEVAEFAGIDPMMTSKVIRTLESRGLLERTDDPNDSRAWRVKLTAKGEPVLVRATSLAKTVDAAFFSPVGSRVVELTTELSELANEPA